jgi:hypothetical protein
VQWQRVGGVNAYGINADWTWLLGELDFGLEMSASTSEPVDAGAGAAPLVSELSASRLVTAIVVGAGNRGQTYARYALERPDLFRIVGVAEPRAYHRESMQKR